MILVTHNVVEAERVLERVAIIANGQMVGIGRVGEIKAQVDNRIRLDLTFKPNSVVNHVCETLFQSNSIHWIGKHRVLILVERARADAAIKLLLSQVNIEQLADFRIQSANLEDVYIQLMSDWNEKE